MRSIPCVAAVISVLFAMGAGDTDTMPRSDLSQDDRVRNLGSGWTKERANILYSLAQGSPIYDVAVVRAHNKPGVFRFEVSEGDRELFAWWGHVNSVFVLNGDRLFYVEFSVGFPGGEVVAVDLKAGKELWKSRLRAIEVRSGQISYTNLINISSDGKVVSIFGNEGLGQYYEEKDAGTGATLVHKVFAK